MRKWFVLSIVLLLLVACDTEDWSNRLPYAGPVEIGIRKGEFLPGTGIQYLGRTEDGAQVSIDGKQALKKVGDSLDWASEMVRGVNVDQTYRVALITEDSLHVAGTVRIIVYQPVVQAEVVNTSAPVHFKLPVGYHVDKDAAIPGTTITYLGKTEQGAQLGNIEGYAYRKLGDSIVWEGKLREGVWIELVLRTALIGDSTLDVIGTADVWIAP
jgi:hypothetical protein